MELKQILSIAKKVHCKHKTWKSCLKVIRKLWKVRRQIKIDMTKEKEEDKLSYMNKKLTLINKRIGMQEKWKSHKNSWDGRKERGQLWVCLEVY